MKAIPSLTLATALLAGGLISPLTLQAQDRAPGYIDFGKFVAPSSGGQFVEVNIQSQLIALAVRLAEKHEPDVADLLRGLKAVRVNVVGVDDENREDLVARLHRIRGELDEKGWQRLVTVQEKQQDVGIYLKSKSDGAIDGLVVTVIDGKKEAVFINVVGSIDPDKLVVIGERLNILPIKKVAKVLEKS